MAGGIWSDNRFGRGWGGFLRSRKRLPETGFRRSRQCRTVTCAAGAVDLLNHDPPIETGRPGRHDVWDSSLSNRPTLPNPIAACRFLPIVPSAGRATTSRMISPERNSAARRARQWCLYQRAARLRRVILGTNSISVRFRTMQRTNLKRPRRRGDGSRERGSRDRAAAECRRRS